MTDRALFLSIWISLLVELDLVAFAVAVPARSLLHILVGRAFK